MFKIKFLFIALLIPIVFSACGKLVPTLQPLPSPESFPTQQSLPSPMLIPTAQQLPNLTGQWTIEMQLSGGFAARNQSIEIASSGAAIANDERSGKTVKYQLTPDELSRLADLVKSSDLKSPGNGPVNCMDCFIYNIQIDSSDGHFASRFDDVSLQDSGISSVIKYLSDLMNRILVTG